MYHVNRIIWKTHNDDIFVSIIIVSIKNKLNQTCHVERKGYFSFQHKCLAMSTCAHKFLALVHM